MEHSGHHFVAIFGGSIAGSEAAFQLAQRGFRVVVFDQNTLPYGKIEDGLPLWHIKLRDKVEQRIDDKLMHPNIRFIPGIKLGVDIDFTDVARNWGFSAVLLAIGAWRDRPIPVKDIDNFVGKGLIYQNPLMYWFNHKHEHNYDGPKFELNDNAIIVGGGLASLDVAKVVMIETVQRALLKRGIKENVFTLEKGISKVLNNHNLTLEELELKGCTLFYRRRSIDMPLTTIQRDTPEKIEKAQTVTTKILNNFKSKYLFKFRSNYAPVDKLIGSHGELEGLVFQKTKIKHGELVMVNDAVEEVKASAVISSIGSLPEKIPGIPFNTTAYKLSDMSNCQVEGFKNVFAIGNAVTGRGNIKESLLHGKITSLKIMDSYLSQRENGFHNYLIKTENNIARQTKVIGDKISSIKPQKDDVIQTILDRTRKLQNNVIFNGRYLDWISKKKPVRLENILDKEEK